MSRNILNEGPEVNVYLNRDAIEATLPVQALQPSQSDPITVSLKGLNGFTGQAGKVMKVNSAENALEYADDSGSNWTVSGNNIYPTTASQLLVNTTSNADNRKLLVNGAGEITGQLTLGSDISDGSNTFTLPNSSGTILITSDLTGYITASSTDTLTNKTLDGTNCKVSTAQFIMEAGAGLKNTISQGYIDFFEAPSNGTNKITLQGIASLAGDTVLNLPGSNGTIALTTDIDTTTETNFGTAATSDVSVGNSAGTAASVGLKLYGDEFLLYNTSNVNVATFTPVSNTCNMTLNGGLITTATLSTNTIWNGNTIGTAYGGTGLTSYTTGDILYASGTNTLAKLAIGTTGQVLKVSGGLPAWGADDSSNWTVSGANIYPTTASQLLVNTTSNTNNRNLLVNGDAEVQGNLSLSSTTSEMEINSNSSTGIYFNNAASSGFKLFADNGNFGCPVVNALSTNTSGWLLDLRQDGTAYHRFKKGNQQLFSNNGGPDLATMYFIKESNILYGNYIENDFTNSTFKLRDFGFNYDNDFMLVNLSSTNRKTTTFNKHAEFKISAGSGSYGDCTLVIEADTDNTVETSNPIIHLRQDGGVVNAYLQLSDNELSLGGTYPGENTTIYTNGGTINMSSDSGSSGNVATLNATLTDIKSTSTKVVKLQTNTIEATNQSNNIITSDATSFQISSGTIWKLSLLNGTSNYPYFGSSGATTDVFFIHINGISGNPYSITNSGGIVHSFRDDRTQLVSGEFQCDDFMRIGMIDNSYTSTINLFLDINHASPTISTATFVAFRYAGTPIGQVYQSGTSAVVYATTSDYRLKENVIECESILDKIDKFSVKEYNFISDREENINQKHIGFIAHEVQEIDERFSRFVMGEKDDIGEYCKCCNHFQCKCGEECMECDEEGNMINKEMRPRYQEIDYGKLTPICIKGIQELHTIIKNQQEEINTLKEILT